MIHCGLVIPPDAEIDSDALKALADETGHRFSYYGTGGFGTELLAELYRDEADNLLITADAIDAGVSAVRISTATTDEAIAIRQAVGDHFGAWSEQTLRAQAERDGVESAPFLLVALAMSNGAGPLEDATVDLINEAVDHEDEQIAGWAALAVRIWNELQNPPMIISAGEERPLAPVLRPADPVDGATGHITAIPGTAPGRTIPGSARWLRAADGNAVFHPAMADHDWSFAVAGAPGSDWNEEIAVTKDERTAIHLLQHSSLDTDYLVVHGDDLTTVVTQLSEAYEAVVLDAPPDLERTR